MVARPLHVVFAPGPIGPLVAARIAATGRRVRVVWHSDRVLRIPGVENVRADVLDGGTVREAVRGAEVVYQCVRTCGVPREQEELLPRAQASLLDAAGRAGARLVVLDDLSAYGRTGGRPITEDTPPAPCSRAGELRARLFEDLAAAACRGDVRAAVGRVSDLFGPAAWESSPLGKRFLQEVVADRPAAVPGDPHARHTYHFSSDVAAALVVLGLDPASDGLWMLPCEPAVSTVELVRHMAAAFGHRFRLRAPAAVARVAARLDRDAHENAYRWEEPVVVVDDRFRARYGNLATPLEHAARQTVEDAVARLTPRSGALGPAAAEPG